MPPRRAGPQARLEYPEAVALNAAEYRRMEAILDDLARLPDYRLSLSRVFRQDSNFPRNPAAQTRYPRYTIARLGS
jgi:hypothetical protein